MRRARAPRLDTSGGPLYFEETRAGDSGGDCPDGHLAGTLTPLPVAPICAAHMITLPRVLVRSSMRTGSFAPHPVLQKRTCMPMHGARSETTRCRRRSSLGQSSPIGCRANGSSALGAHSPCMEEVWGEPDATELHRVTWRLPLRTARRLASTVVFHAQVGLPVWRRSGQAIGRLWRNATWWQSPGRGACPLASHAESPLVSEARQLRKNEVPWSCRASATAL